MNPSRRCNARASALALSTFAPRVRPHSSSLRARAESSRASREDNKSRRARDRDGRRATRAGRTVRERERERERERDGGDDGGRGVRDASGNSTVDARFERRG